MKVSILSWRRSHQRYTQPVGTNQGKHLSGSRRTPVPHLTLLPRRFPPCPRFAVAVWCAVAVRGSRIVRKGDRSAAPMLLSRPTKAFGLYGVRPSHAPRAAPLWPCEAAEDALASGGGWMGREPCRVSGRMDDWRFAPCVHFPYRGASFLLHLGLASRNSTRGWVGCLAGRASGVADVDAERLCPLARCAVGFVPLPLSFPSRALPRRASC